LHARWNLDGTKICVNSAPDGTPQMYEVDVTDIVDVPADANRR
jgi:Tol biopolymer transport system component